MYFVYLHLSLNSRGHWGTTEDLTITILCTLKIPCQCFRMEATHSSGGGGFSSLARIWGDCLTIHSPLAPFFSFFRGDLLARTNSTLYARISPQWFSELRWLWPSVPWYVACELVFLRNRFPHYALGAGACMRTVTIKKQTCKDFTVVWNSSLNACYDLWS